MEVEQRHGGRYSPVSRQALGAAAAAVIAAPATNHPSAAAA